MEFGTQDLSTTVELTSTMIGHFQIIKEFNARFESRNARFQSFISFQSSCAMFALRLKRQRYGLDDLDVELTFSKYIERGLRTLYT